MSETDYSSDYLKPLEAVLEPDRRNAGEYPSFLGGGPRKIDSFHENISQYELIDLVPQDVRVQFETAKNLYLYSWFVYRFFNVADHLAYNTLEFGLRELFKDCLPDKYKDRFGNSSLKKLLSYAIDSGYIKNDDFETHRHNTWRRAKSRYEFEKIQEMKEKELTEISWDESEVEIRPEDHAEYLEILLESLPFLRNKYAHGSGTLYPSVLGTFQLVSEMLNSAYQRKAGL